MSRSLGLVLRRPRCLLRRQKRSFLAQLRPLAVDPIEICASVLQTPIAERVALNVLPEFVLAVFSNPLEYFGIGFEVRHGLPPIAPRSVAREGSKADRDGGVSLFLHAKNYIHRGSAGKFGDQVCPTLRVRPAEDLDALSNGRDSRRAHRPFNLEPDVEHVLGHLLDIDMDVESTVLGHAFHGGLQSSQGIVA
ncbi:hypothetical protein CNECB9_5340015 [Cupriavidus necator]|uniref:Uncharacterized protein n=1 Tax=Cupriavidus necator TaxID=106590 RepID=A0A1K0JX40_CUPNE|nr:hypothetical protein CNECB9_5340015 [Cupriavidus necator]